MAGPNPIIFFFFYKMYRKRFYKNPKNANKKPMGCLCWFVVFLFKIFLFSFICMLIFLLVEWFTELFI